MAKSTLKTPVAEEQNIRRRIDALTGNVKVTRAMVRGSIQPLVDKLARQAAARSENDRILVQHTNNLARFSPGEALSVTGEELDAMKAYKAALDRIPVPDEKYDPWGGARATDTKASKKKN